MASNMRVRLFVDFWNFQIGWNECQARLGATNVVPIPWKIMPAVLTAEVAQGQPSKYAGAHVYASVDPSSPKDRKLNMWLHHVLASFAGYALVVKERKPRKIIRCKDENCKAAITTCPKCNKPLKGTVEKGIDAAVITDMLSLAFDDNYDVAVLVSGDADYAPAVQYIQKKTDKQIVQAFFKAHGDELRNACWDHLFFEDLMPKLVPATKPASPPDS